MVKGHRPAPMPGTDASGRPITAFQGDEFHYETACGGSHRNGGFRLHLPRRRDHAGRRAQGHLLLRRPGFPVDGCEYVRADLTNREDCLRAAKGCDAAVLMAAVTGGAKSAKDAPFRQATDNLVMDAQLLQALYEQGVKKVVYVSTVTVYQEFEGTIAEDDLDLNRDPHGAYFGVGWAKRSAEKALPVLAREHGHGRQGAPRGQHLRPARAL